MLISLLRGRQNPTSDGPGGRGLGSDELWSKLLTWELYIYICIYIYMYVYIYMYIPSCIHVYIYIYMYV